MLVGLVKIALCFALQAVDARRFLLGLIGRALGGAETGVQFFNLKLMVISSQLKSLDFWRGKLYVNNKTSTVSVKHDMNKNHSWHKKACRNYRAKNKPQF